MDDPFSLLAVAVWTLAAGMYPLGFMFGVCSACCDRCRSDTCEGFDLEEAFSRRGEGTSYCPEFTQGPPLLSLSFSSPCFGGGAAGTVDAPGGNAPGPLEGATLTSPGSGYAKFGNKAPTLSLANVSTVAAIASVTLNATKDACGVDYWQVQSLSVTSGGRGYSHGQAVSLSLGEGTVQETKASATLVTENTQPTLTASASPGSGGIFAVKVESAGDALPHQQTWRIASISVAGETSGYSNGSALEFAGEGVTVGYPAIAVIETSRSQPTLSASAAGGVGEAFAVTTSSYGNSPEAWYVASVSVTTGGAGYPGEGYLTFSGGTEEYAATAYFYSGRTQPSFSTTAAGLGSGASITAALSQTIGYDGRAVWFVSSVTISAGGSGYSQGDDVYFNVSDGIGFGGYGYVSSVDENGAITGVDLGYGGEAYKSDGVIDSVDVFDGGSYYGDTGEIENIRIDDGGSYYVAGVLTGISVLSGGKYYHPDPALAPYVRPPAISIQQYPPSRGVGGQITAVVDSDTSSATFGRVSSLTVEAAGDGYLAWEFVSDFTYIGDGKFALGTATPGGGGPDLGLPASRTTRIRKGCWVSGDGIAFGTRVTDMTAEVLEEWVLAPKRGCCRYSYVRQRGFFGGPGGIGTPVFTPDSVPPETVNVVTFSSPLIVEDFNFLTQDGCQTQYDSIEVGSIVFVGGTAYRIESKEFGSWDECLDCNGNATLGRIREVDRVYTGRVIVTVDPPPVEAPTGCVQFCGPSGLCGAFPTRPTDETPVFGTPDTVEGGPAGPKTGCCRFTYVKQPMVLPEGEENVPENYVESGEPQTVTENVIRTEVECEDQFATLPNVGEFVGGFSQFGGNAKLVSKTFDSWDECLDCDENPILNGGCATWTSIPESTDDFRRMCVRWLCRCYEGTGKKNQTDSETGEPLFPDPYDWYTVESTTEVGGPVVFGGTITEKLEAAEGDGYYGYSKFEHDTIFGGFEWSGAAGDRFCLVYAFVFYGTSVDAAQDRCQAPDGKDRNPKVVEPKDAYQIFPCDRCS